ncbi:NAD(P)-dependent dehydrogenase (short-subunit alcohol dehydrogenase family) [Thermosporothrix hazakensis]|jgi:NAD(P)-dependent dehydrogenase (short-subunit alcohol dehydrogenase family)|uniref:NAD(P)-dependent dehydrogenase (Short-subunit alcohol dehydrogenase family) n=2 Tax=Thermosporothrix TaxID=768650 RepID=A0A326U0V9_THEHA|nr:SDR family oxidoreductase [Thermosporothrix hazakensis]PZW24104.1 NAD(P)-dependent dehydrogenase (short-subunit alcohol dehydrogenase family) [Thermosporothrix hazakensis]BBH87892.1 short-chain dehydrogenase [Thermosporothrix sp. COM3]GCE50316.1 short-chain dehydrogenase [Thermosporothrix hazakensis]
MKPLAGKVAVVAGATRGAGRGIALMLGEAGATVYVTGRSTREQPSDMGRPETIEETVELIAERGGVGIAVRVDYSVDEEVRQLFQRVGEEQNGQLDILVNDLWGINSMQYWEKPFWETPLSHGLLMQERALFTHLRSSYYGAPLMVARKQGLIVEVTDGVGYHYRGNLYYSLAKVGNVHLAEALAAELRPYHVAVVSLTPGYLRSEAMLEKRGVTEANWQEVIKTDPHFAASETPGFIGRAVVALASDPDVFAKTGQSLSSWDLSEEYGFTDLDGRRPHWGRHIAEHGL